MKVSLNWVNRYVDLHDITPEEIANRLTFAGIEVEGIERRAVGTNLVTAHVLEARLMENSDHLSICQVDMGSKYGTAQIVCGAPNVKTGQKVIVARPGAVLSEVKISKSNIRGHESNGMICSLLELGVDKKFLSQESIEGIEELPEDTPIGREDVLALLGLEDTILNLKLLANRPDALAVYNIARELATLFDRPLKSWQVSLNQGKAPKFEVAVTTDKCPQFSIRTVMGIGHGHTPAHIEHALSAMGMRPISPLVDISNYVMLLTGQPLHIYDIDRLEEAKLTIVDGVKHPFYALDDNEYQTEPSDIAIFSGQTIACLAGVMGSNKTGVTQSTKNIAIEAANFHGATIRQTSIRLNLPSESSQRFIKGINPHQAEAVLDFTIHLIGEVLGYDEYSATIAHDKINHQLKQIPFTYEAINARLGTNFSHAQIDTTLAKVGIKVKSNELLAIIPAHRIDIEGVSDLSEEVIRILGFEHIDVKLPPLTALHAGLSTNQVKTDNIRRYLRDRGLDEVVSYTLLHQREIGKFRLLNQDEVYKLGNPMSDEREYVRGGLLYSLLKVANYNVARQNKNLAMFEISSIETKALRSTYLGAILVGQRYRRGRLDDKPYDFYDAKGLVESMMNILGIEAGRYRFEPLVKCEQELHPGQSATIIIDNKVIGALGTLSPLAYSEFDFKKEPVVLLELDFGYLLGIRVSSLKMSPLSKYPTVSRDLAIIVDKKIDANSLVRVIRKTSKDLIRSVDIFDVYTGQHIDNDKKSIALSIELGSDKKTLTEAECGETIEKIKVALAQTFNASFRI
ncbi:MAG TPA: phenylalanine--tRNA ligase subunit beta [Bacilli bacterium]|nr:phenylalanine--tRNA ligase subunit beta [Bacilli bacterium]